MSNRIVLVIVSLFALSLAAQDTRPTAAPGLQPSLRLDLSSAGYKELSAMARRSDKVNFTIDFLDREHLLLTYNPKKMITRLPGCPPTHDDHLIHAAVLDTATGKVLHSADWYLHDGWRYLWPLGSGKILLRKLNSLYVIDSDLHEKLLFTSPEDLLWVTVTPDGKQIVTETLDPDAAKSKKKDSRTRVRIEFRDAETLAVERTIKSEKEIHMEATSSGFARVISGLSGRVWLVRFGPSEQQRENIARVRTRRRAPDILYLSGNTMLIGRDSASHPGYSVSAFTVTGNRLWRQHWDEHRYSLLVERSEDGSRFAISTLRPVDLKPATSAASSSDDDVEGLEQSIQLFDTASGSAVLSVDASPVVLSGQNFSLSPDGRRLAVLHGSAVDLYELPDMSADERAKYTAVKADVPGLYMPPTPAAESADQEAAFTAPDENGMAPERPQTTPAKSATDAKPTEAASASQAAPATPQAPATKPVAEASSNVPTFRSRRQIVALDVVVADAKGHPIRGVSQKDLVVKEDGKPQTVSYFNEVSSAAPPALTPPPAAPPASATTQPPESDDKKPPNIFTNDTPPQTPSAITVILYDLLNTPAPEQQRAKLELLSFIEHKPKGEKFALCTLANGLRMIQGFTPDETVLARAIKANKGSLRYSSMRGQDATDAMLISWLEQGAANNIAQFGSNVGTSASSLRDLAGRLEQDTAERRSRDLEMRMALTMDAFTHLARYLSALPGRKSLIWLSGSFPLGIFPGMDFRNPYSENKTDTEQMKQAVNLLAESHVAVYPVDVRGLTGYAMTASTYTNSLDSTQPGPAPTFDNQASNTQRFDELANLNSAGGIGPNLPGDSPFMEEMTDHGIMDQIAADTGGKAFYNANGIEQAMDIAMEQETNYYALSYTPINKKYDGKFRRIKVSIAAGDKKVHVIHRSGYFAMDPDAPSTLSRDASTGFGLAAMQHDAPESRQLVFEARVVPLGKPTLAMDPRAVSAASANKKKKSRRETAQPAEPIEMQAYQIDYAISPSQLRFDPTSDGREHGAMNFMVASFDADGTVRTSIGSHVKGDLSAAAYQDVMTGGFRLHQEVTVPVAAASLRLGVQDAISGRIGTLEIPLPVKAPPGVEQSRGPHLPEIEPD